jgi:hypothetical protein
LIEGGMRPTITLADFDLARLFAPLQADIRKRLNFTYYIRKDLFNPNLFQYHKTLFTKGDTNQDRPTSIYVH